MHAKLRSGGRALALAGGLACQLAQAQGVFLDDFESGTLLTTDAPMGKWTGIVQPAPMNTLGAFQSAAHRGAFGLRLSDANGASSSTDEGHLYRTLGFSTSQLWTRTWFRYSAAGQGTLSVQRVVGMGSAGPALADVMLDVSLGRVSLSVHGDAVSLAGPATAAVGPGTWHLLELAVDNVGTANGDAALWVDGLDAGAISGIAWPSDSLTQFALGEPATNGSWSGTLDYDDARAATVPLASRLTLSSPSSQLAVGSCAAITLGLVDSNGGLAVAPYPCVSALSVAPALGAFFSDSACGTAAGTATLSQASFSTVVYYRPTAAGAQTLTATATDYFAAALTLTSDGGVVDAGESDAGGVAPVDGGAPSDAGGTDGGRADGGPGPAGGGTDAGPSGRPGGGPPLTVGCSTSAALGTLALAGLLLLAVWRSSRLKSG